MGDIAAGAANSSEREYESTTCEASTAVIGNCEFTVKVRMHASGIADAFAYASCCRASARAWAAPFGLFTGRGVSPEDPPPC